MRFEDVRAHVDGVPHISARRGRQLYDFVREHRPEHVLELGFAHGASTCYIAAALEENGSGTVSTVDVMASLSRQPSIEDLLDRTGLSPWVEVHREETSYTWYLKRVIDARTSSASADRYVDFCFIDGAHTWDADGFAFFLVDKLLKDGAWLLVDDLDWTLGDSAPELPVEQRTDAQVRSVFELLVMQHPDYAEFRIDDAWGWARRQPGGDRTLTIEPVGALRGVARRLLGR